jgi:hypothetical protein
VTDNMPSNGVLPVKKRVKFNYGEPSRSLKQQVNHAFRTSEIFEDINNESLEIEQIVPKRLIV